MKACLLAACACIRHPQYTGIGITIIGALIQWPTLLVLTLAGGHVSAFEHPYRGFVYEQTVARVLPESGFQSRIRVGDSIVRLVQHGVIDVRKFENLYAGRGGLPAELKKLLTAPSNAPMRLTRQNANLYVNLLWPVGLANHMASNAQSPINKGS